MLSVESRRGEAEGAEERARARHPVTLVAHTHRVVAEAEGLAHRLGLTDAQGRIIALAARLHDQGKAANRWQRVMRAPAENGPWAKTRGGDGRALGGYRHEFGSLLAALDDPELAMLAPEERDLVLHLIAAHHGHARPGISPLGCDEAPPSLLADRVREAALRFARLQTHWGPWGLAWWGALLRAADRRASAAEEAADG